MGDAVAAFRHLIRRAETDGLERFLAVAPPSVYAGEIRSVRAWLTSTRGA